MSRSSYDVAHDVDVLAYQPLLFDTSAETKPLALTTSVADSRRLKRGGSAQRRGFVDIVVLTMIVLVLLVAEKVQVNRVSLLV